MAIHWKALVGCLRHPRSGLKGIAGNVTATDGLLLTLLFSATSAVSGAIISLAVTIPTSAWSYAITAASIPLSALFFIYGSLFAHLFGRAFEGKASFGRTLGCLGHTHLAGFLAGAVITLLSTATIILSRQGNSTGSLATVILLASFGLLAFIYLILLGGGAIASAHKISWGAGIGAFILGWLVAILLLIPIIIAGSLLVFAGIYNWRLFPL